MSSLSQFVGGSKPPRAIFNKTSTTGAIADDVASTVGPPVRSTTTGAVSAGVLVTALSLTGSGVVSLAQCVGLDTTSRTHRFRLTIDGVVVYDATTAAVAATNRGIQLIGYIPVVQTSVNLDPIPYNISFLLEYASSLSETAKTQFNLIYRTN